MSYIARTGNLTKTPKLLQGEKGSYTFLNVAVTDRIKRDDEFVDGPTTYYDVSVSGRTAEEVVATAERDGNIRIFFAGELVVSEFAANNGNIYRQNRVFADDIGASFRGQQIQVSKGGRQAQASPEHSYEEPPAQWDQPTW